MVKPGDKIFLITATHKSSDENRKVVTKTWELQITDDTFQHKHVYGFCTEGGNYAHQVAGCLFSEHNSFGYFVGPEDICSIEEARKILKTILKTTQEALAELPEEIV